MAYGGGPPPPPERQQSSWQPPAQSGPPQWGAPQPSTPQWGVQPWGSAPPRRTNPLAIVSLVAGLAQFLLPFIAAVVAIVTGHIARSQIRRSNEEGSGMALAGLILGYIGVALSVLAVGGVIIFFAVFADDVSQLVLRERARDFAHAIERSAVVGQTTPRDPRLLEDVWLRETTTGCCDGIDVYLPDGTLPAQATVADYQRNGWRIEMKDDDFRTSYACLTIPPRASMRVVVNDGRCTPGLQDGSATGR
jgi:hypothetical protein